MMTINVARFIEPHPVPVFETHHPQFHIYPNVEQNIPRPTWKGTMRGLGYQDYYGRPIAVPGMSRQIAIPKSEMIAPAAFYRQGRMRGLGECAPARLGGLLDTRGWDLGLWGLSYETSSLDSIMGGCPDPITAYHYAAKQGVVRGAIVFGSAALLVGAGLGFWLGKRKK